ncbi:hypothetical protein GTZ99_07130 [Novosphingobium sp. FSY-8]|uniref:DUF3618 domain-containing protein n=1 Tax=Novosphingobium ovatum TaxID=1908523 RepID=A0ABW9XCR4_9SPHN|nr:hypothetical protein [Novosphingobium ovatum]NBC36329.1 hypothetical protein [Novosphingobium ovatum]
MNREDMELEALRAARDSARGRLAAQVDGLRDLARPGALTQRIRDEVEDRSRDALYQAMEIASDQRGILAGTLTALALWAVRKRLLAKAGDALAKGKRPKAVNAALDQARALLEKALAKLDKTPD